jgi:HK97 family phage portal protein
VSIFRKRSIENLAKAPSFAPRRIPGFTLGGSAGASRTDCLGKSSEVGTLYAIVSRTSSATAMVEWGLYRKPSDDKVLEDSERVPVGRHAALDLWRTPNPHMTRYELVEVCQQHLDLVGECFLVVVKAGKLPIELWPIRPDKIEPVPSPTKFLAGYVYTNPDGEKVPLGVDDVIHIKLPNPLNPYRGMGPVQSIMAELDASQYSAQWNRNFFLNSARPGGLIEVERRLSDEEFDEMGARWREQHQGVANAHRVAIIEQGKWVENAFTMRDMEFPLLRQVNRDTIMEAFGISKPMLGITDDVNRANAEASIYMFARYQQVPRLQRWREALNHKLLPMFGSTTKSIEFDYEDPVAQDSEQAALNRDSRIRSVMTLCTLPGYKFDMEALLDAYDLPQVPFEEIELPGVNAPPPQEPPGALRAGQGQSGKGEKKDDTGKSGSGSGGRGRDGDGDGLTGENWTDPNARMAWDKDGKYGEK